MENTKATEVETYSAAKQATGNLAVQLKQPKTYVEQVEIIRSKGFVIHDAEACISFLKRANYYRLSAYFLPFKQNNGSYFP